MNLLNLKEEVALSDRSAMFCGVCDCRGGHCRSRAPRKEAASTLKQLLNQLNGLTWDVFTELRQ